MNNKYLDKLQVVVDEDVRHLKMKEKTYGDSWKKRGGVGAFMMMARKWDRIENILAKGAMPYDVFSHIKLDPSGDDSTVLAEVRDLRRYLALVEAEMIAAGVVADPGHLSPEQKIMRRDNAGVTVSIEDIEPYVLGGRKIDHPSPFGYESDEPAQFPRIVKKEVMEQMRDFSIAEGSMKNRKFCELYIFNPAFSHYNMIQTFVEEYGKEEKS